jgi:hypothetical protein
MKEEEEIGVICSMHWRYEIRMQRFSMNTE